MLNQLLLVATLLTSDGPIVACREPLGIPIERAAKAAPFGVCVKAMREFIACKDCTIYPAGTKFTVHHGVQLPADLGPGVAPVFDTGEMAVGQAGSAEELCADASAMPKQDI